MEPIEQTEQAPKRRVKFGNGPAQSIPHEWAESILTEWRNRDPHGFGRYIAWVASGEFPSNGRPRRSGPS